MKKQRAPYARRSVWYAIGILSVVLVAVCVVAGYEINHLRTQADGLQTQVTRLQHEVTQIYSSILKLAEQQAK